MKPLDFYKNRIGKWKAIETKRYLNLDNSSHLDYNFKIRFVENNAFPDLILIEKEYSTIELTFEFEEQEKFKRARRREVYYQGLPMEERVLECSDNKLSTIRVSDVVVYTQDIIKVNDDYYLKNLTETTNGELNVIGVCIEYRYE